MDLIIDLGKLEVPFVCCSKYSSMIHANIVPFILVF